MVRSNTHFMNLEQIENRTIQGLLSTEREGITDMIYYMHEYEYFSQPASHNHHLAIDGGLGRHSHRCREVLGFKCSVFNIPIPKDSLEIIPYCHDFCKMETDDNFPGHGQCSIDRITQFIDLTPLEHDCILYHMGLFSVYGYGCEYTVQELYDAINRNALVQIFASTDMEVSRMPDDFSNEFEIPFSKPHL